MLGVKNIKPEDKAIFVRRYYFGELDGDQYMTAMFSNWAKEYGGDASIVIGGK